MKKKSIVLNAFVNGTRTILSLVFPLITYPYISTVLGVDNMGKFNFSNSVCNYFSLFAALGISTYSIREGANYRYDRGQLSKFASEVFTINILSTVFSFLLLFASLLISNKLQHYTTIILILSISMIFSTIGCDWIYSIFEEYMYIALRTIAVQVLSLILLFVFVKNENDINIYAFTIMISASGAGIMNYIGLKKYVDIKPIFDKRILIHLSPMFVLFANTLATTVYVNSDIIILGFLKDDYNVGIYSTATKIYNIIKQFLSAVIVVSIPRLSMFWGMKKKDEFKALLTKIISILTVLVFPAIMGLISLSKEAVILISSKEYINAYKPLIILSITLCFCMFNWFYTSCILIPTNNEKIVMKATIISALLNVILNFVLIPFLNVIAAAITTLISESVSLIICYIESKKYYKTSIKLKEIAPVLCGCIYIVVICRILRVVIGDNMWIFISVAFVLSVFGYFIILYLSKNSIVRTGVNIIVSKLKRDKIGG